MFFRLTDRRYRNIQKAIGSIKQQEEKSEKAIAVYGEKKINELTNCGAVLSADKSAAKALLANVEDALSRFREYSRDIETVNRRLSEYDKSLGDLLAMTGRVEDNLQRVAAESAFVEEVSVKLNGAKEKYEELMRNISESRDKIELNTSDLLITIEKSVIGVKSQTDEILHSQKKEFEVQMEKHRTMLKEAVDHAGARAGKLEDEIFSEFKKQTDDRAVRMRAEVELFVKNLKNDLDSMEGDTDRLRTAASEVEALENKVNAALSGIDAELAERRGAAVKNIEAVEAELKLLLEEMRENITKQIYDYEKEASELSAKAGAEYTNSLENITTKVRSIESDIDKIKTDAYRRSEENLRRFEDDFAADLERRSANLETRWTEWRDTLNGRFNTITEGQEAECRKIEAGFSEGLRKKTAELDTAFLNEVDKIKTTAADIEEDVRKQLENAEKSVSEFKEQVKADFSELRENLISQLNSEIARNSLESGDKIKNYMRLIDQEEKEIHERLDAQNNAMNILIAKSRGDIDSMREYCETGIKETTNTIDEIRKKSRDAEEKIDDFFAQSKVIDKTVEMKNALEQDIDDIRDKLQHLELQKADIENIEAQFSKLKRMEDDINAKMSRFLTEQRRIDLMEENFRKLIQTSSAVEEKLSSLTEKNDLLQELQFNYRKLSDAMSETEEKYSRIEKKNQILDATNEGIDKNFKQLQESEKTAQQFETTVGHITAELTEIRTAVENLLSENIRVLDTSEKLTSLDTKLAEIEKRIEDMNIARQWLADLEGRMNKVYSEANNQVKLAGELLKRDGFKSAQEPGAPTPSQRDQILSLTRQGWKPKEIAKSLNIALGAVELILETSSGLR